MPATVVQDWTSATTGFTSAPTTATVNLGVAATAGNTLLVAVNSDATVATPSGYTQVPSAVSVHNAGCYLFAMIATGGETGVTVTPNVPASTCVAIAELGNLSGASIALQADVATSNGTTGGVFNLSTGTTATTAQADEYAVYVWGYSASQAQLANGGSNQWSAQTNGAVEKLDTGTTKASGTNVGLCVAAQALSSTGAVESTATALGGGVYSAESLVATFKAAAAAVAGPPARPVVVSFAVARSTSW